MDFLLLLLSLVLWVLLIAVFVRALVSWFPVRQDSDFVRMLDSVTEPLIGPVRRVVPRIGIFDISGMLVIVVLYMMLQAVGIARDR